MKKFYNEDYQETFYHKKLTNGLDVILFEKPKFATNFFSLITPYGSNGYQQKDEDDNKFHLPAGVAHFLEHQMFHFEDIDVMTEFSKMGASCNAATSYDMTYYYFSTTNDIYQPLELLLDFVQDFSANEDSVEKEKGIIVEELMMYQNNPDQRLYFDLLNMMFVNHPYKDDLGGSKASVNATSLKDLQVAYKLNYHPEKMFLVGSTNQPINQVIQFIEHNQQSKKFSSYIPAKPDYDSEPVKVAERHRVTKMPVENEKIAVGLKFLHDYNDIDEIDVLEWGIQIYLDTIFSSVNPKYQEWIDKKLINDYFSVDFTLEQGFGFLIFVNENISMDTFLDFINDEIIHHQLDDQVFKQIQKKVIGRSIKSYEKPSNLAQAYGRSLVNGVNLFDSLNNLAKAQANKARKALLNFLETSELSVHEIKRK